MLEVLSNLGYRTFAAANGEEAIKVFEEPAIKARTDGFGLIPVFSTPEEFARFYREDVEGFKRIVRDAKIPLQE